MSTGSMSSRHVFSVVVTLGVGVALSGCAVNASDGTAEVAEFPTAVAFDYQLGGAYEPPSGVEIVGRDRNEAPATGVYSICYVNGFQTQPGEQDDWPEDALLHDADGPVFDADWPDEILLDTSTPAKRSLIVEMVTPWIEGCATAGYRAVEFDNLDSFTRSHDALSFEDNLALATDLARIAHDAGLAVGQKNSAEYAAELHERAGFDFAVTEECAAYEECDAYVSVYQGAVIDIEYTDTLPRSFDEMCADPASPASMILRDRNLVTPDDDAYVYETCGS